MGGAVAINAIGQIPEIDGLISLSAYSAWDEVFVDNVGLPEPLATLQRPFVRLYTSLKYGPDTRHITPAPRFKSWATGRPCSSIRPPIRRFRLPTLSG